MPSHRPTASSLLQLLAIGSVLGILLVTLLPAGHHKGELIISPFADIRRMLVHRDAQSTLQVVGNVLLFMPLGFFIPLAVLGLNRLGRVALVAASLSITVETLQYFLPLGRIASSDDVLLNVTGGICGFLLMRAVQRFSLGTGLLRPESYHEHGTGRTPT